LACRKCGYESRRHVSERFALLFLADPFDGLGDRDEVTLQGSLAKGALLFGKY